MIMKKTNLRSINFAKYLILPFLLLSFCIACNQQANEGSSKKDQVAVDPIEGVWELTNKYWVKDGDTLISEPDQLGEHKIYLNGYVMWTANPGPDSAEWHSFGTYKLSNETLIETLSEEEVIFNIEFEKDFCKQATETVLRNTDYLLVKEWKKLK